MSGYNNPAGKIVREEVNLDEVLTKQYDEHFGTTDLVKGLYSESKECLDCKVPVHETSETDSSLRNEDGTFHVCADHTEYHIPFVPGVGETVKFAPPEPELTRAEVVFRAGTVKSTHIAEIVVNAVPEIVNRPVIDVIVGDGCRIVNPA